jgi:hypothetical protein
VSHSATEAEVSVGKMPCLVQEATYYETIYETITLVLTGLALMMAGGGANRGARDCFVQATDTTAYD